MTNPPRRFGFTTMVGTPNRKIAGSGGRRYRRFRRIIVRFDDVSDGGFWEREDVLVTILFDNGNPTPSYRYCDESVIKSNTVPSSDGFLRIITRQSTRDADGAGYFWRGVRVRQFRYVSACGFAPLLRSIGWAVLLTETNVPPPRRPPTRSLTLCKFESRQSITAIIIVIIIRGCAVIGLGNKIDDDKTRHDRSGENEKAEIINACVP